MDIPRDVLLAGARAALLAEGFSPENPHLDEVAEDWIDGTANILVPAIVAAIEAWENRPHPWAQLPTADAGTDKTPPLSRRVAWGMLGIDPSARTDREAVADETAEAIAAWAEDSLIGGYGAAIMIRRGEWREHEPSGRTAEQRRQDEADEATSREVWGREP